MTNLTEIFPCFFLSCKANVRVKPTKTGHGPHSSKLLFCSMYFCVDLCIVCFVSFSVLFVCLCVPYDCHRVATQLQLNISYHINSSKRAAEDLSLDHAAIAIGMARYTDLKRGFD
jgi:hypothetical protein